MLHDHGQKEKVLHIYGKKNFCHTDVAYLSTLHDLGVAHLWEKTLSKGVAYLWRKKELCHTRVLHNYGKMSRRCTFMVNRTVCTQVLHIHGKMSRCRAFIVKRTLVTHRCCTFM